jgi:hypothetical protein
LTLAGATRVGRADEPVGSTVRYNREVVRIFERKCVMCHAESNGLAMPLASFSDVRSWARSIREEILERRMPPWPAAAGVKPLANELSLTIREIVILTSWIDGGTLRGEPSDLPPSKPAVVWPAGEPDLKLSLPEQRVTLDDRPLVVRVDLSAPPGGDRWLRGFDVSPGARNALRSVLLFMKTARGERWLGGWTPWHAMTTSPDVAAHQIPAGTPLIAELHYKGWADAGGTASDRSVLGLYFRQQPAERAFQELGITTAPVTAAGSRRKLRGEAVLNQDGMVWALRPSLERDGVAVEGSIEVSASRPDGGIEPLLWVKDNQPDWQIPYVLRDPVTLPRGTRVIVTAYSTDAAASSRVSILWYPAAATKTASARPTPPSLPR